VTKDFSDVLSIRRWHKPIYILIFPEMFRPAWLLESVHPEENRHRNHGRSGRFSRARARERWTIYAFLACTGCDLLSKKHDHETTNASISIRRRDLACFAARSARIFTVLRCHGWARTLVDTACFARRVSFTSPEKRCRRRVFHTRHLRTPRI